MRQDWLCVTQINYVCVSGVCVCVGGRGIGRRERPGQDCEADDSFGGLSHFLSPCLFSLQLPSTFGFPHNLFPWGLTWEVGLGLPQVLQGAYLLESQDSKDEGLYCPRLMLSGRLYSGRWQQGYIIIHTPGEKSCSLYGLFF